MPVDYEQPSGEVLRQLTTAVATMQRHLESLFEGRSTRPYDIRNAQAIVRKAIDQQLYNTSRRNRSTVSPALKRAVLENACKRLKASRPDLASAVDVYMTCLARASRQRHHSSGPVS